MLCLLATSCGGRASQGSGEPPMGVGDDGQALWSETWVAETRGLGPEELSWRGLGVPIGDRVRRGTLGLHGLAPAPSGELAGLFLITGE
jgi:hypothetical protein